MSGRAQLVGVANSAVFRVAQATVKQTAGAHTLVLCQVACRGLGGSRVGLSLGAANPAYVDCPTAQASLRPQARLPPAKQQAGSALARPLASRRCAQGRPEVRYVTQPGGQVRSPASRAIGINRLRAHVCRPPRASRMTLAEPLAAGITTAVTSQPASRWQRSRATSSMAGLAQRARQVKFGRLAGRTLHCASDISKATTKIWAIYCSRVSSDGGDPRCPAAAAATSVVSVKRRRQT